MVYHAQNERQRKPSQVHNRICVPDCREAGGYASLTSEITSNTANINTLKADLKEKKVALKKVEKELTSLEAKKAKADAKAGKGAKKAEVEAVLKKLLASGVSEDEILEKLK